METLDLRQVRRLALARAGLLKPEWTALPARATGAGKRARAAALAVIDRFGYLQLDTVSVAGARSHGLVLLSRLEGMAPELAEELLRPGEPLFEYWGHEASWMPLELYPAFEFRRREFDARAGWSEVLRAEPKVARELLARVRSEGPIRSLDLEEEREGPWWGYGTAKKVMVALWCRGDLAIRERRNFHRSYDLAERVIPAELLASPLPREASLPLLLLRALAGHGWATTGTLAATFRLRNLRPEIEAAFALLQEQGEIVPCKLAGEGRNGGATGWVRPQDLELAARLETIRPRRDVGVLLSPFDPVLWDRPRALALFGFEQVLEIYKPAPDRRFGYFCLPVLAGERLVARLDLKARSAERRLELVALHYEDGAGTTERQAVHTAVTRYAEALALLPPVIP